MADAVEIRVEWPEEYEMLVANAFRAARVRDHVEVMWGYVPVSVVTDMIAGNRDAGTVTVQRVHGTFMSATSLRDLYAQVKRIHDALVLAGVLPDDSSDDPDVSSENDGDDTA